MTLITTVASLWTRLFAGRRALLPGSDTGHHAPASLRYPGERRAAAWRERAQQHALAGWRTSFGG
jgi:hypothetical protein